MSKLFVPIIVNGVSALFSVTTKELFGYSESFFNGCKYPFLNSKLTKCFDEKALSYEILEINKTPEEAVFENFSESTMSISLGVFCSAYATLNKKELKQRYDSITITGDFDISDGKVILKAVSDIEKKFEAVKKNAETSLNNKHLFLYVCDDEKNPIKEGWYDNIFVVAFSSKDKIECVLSEIFELEEKQEKLVKPILEANYKNEYIETQTFIEWKKELVQNNCGGFLLQGKTNCGKTIAAASLCKYLISTSTVSEIIWITISDNKHFWNTITQPNIFDFDKTQAIKNEFSEKFDKLDKALSEKKNCCLVLDNIEGEYLDEILSFIENNYLQFLSVNLLKLIITTWYKAEDTLLLRRLSLSEKNAEELEINKSDFRSIIYSVLDTFSEKSVFYESPIEQREKLTNLLYKQCRENNKIFPGYVPLALAPLSDIGLKNLISRYEKDDIKNLSSKKRILKIAFETLDISSQLVLLTYLGLNNYRHELASGQICKLINEKIFNSQIVGESFFTKEVLYRSLRKLVKKDFLQREVSIKKDSAHKVKKTRYFVKKDVFEYCVFSRANSEEFSNEFVLVRNALIPIDIKIDIAIQYDLFNEYSELLKTYTNSEMINKFFIKCLLFRRGLKYLTLLEEKGISTEYEDENGFSAFNAFWFRNSDIEVFDYLLKRGFTRDKIQLPNIPKEMVDFSFVSPFMMAVDENYVPLIRKAIQEHFYDDINRYAFNRFALLQLHTRMGTSVEIVQLLIDSGADILLKTKREGWSLLTCAVLNDTHPEILEYIIKNNLYGDVYSRDNAGKTALDHAKELKNSYAIKLLEPLYK